MRQIEIYQHNGKYGIGIDQFQRQWPLKGVEAFDCIQPQAEPEVAKASVHPHPQFLTTDEKSTPCGGASKLEVELRLSAWGARARYGLLRFTRTG